MSMPNIQLICIFCHAPADLLCQRCRDPYCSAKCQQTDWPQHKLNCFPMPVLVKATTEAGHNAKPESESNVRKPECDVNLKSSATPKQRSTDSNVDKRNEASSGSSVGNRLNQYNRSTNSNANPPPVEKSAISDKPDMNLRKPMHPKPPQIDAASIRRPGTLSQVITKPKPVEINPAPVKSEEPTPAMPVMPVTAVAPLVTPAPSVTPVVENPQLEEKNVPLVVRKMGKLNVALIEPEITKTEKWMTPFPIDENVFVPVIVQYISPDNTVWVTAVSNESANTNLLREINKTISTTTTPQSHEIKVNGLFAVPFEDIHYRGIILDPVSAQETVNVRLIDYGNYVTLPIGELKHPIPSMTNLNAFTFPIKFKTSRNVEIGNQINIKTESINGDVMTVIVEGDIPLLTMKDIETVPIPMDVTKKLFCLDFSNIAEGYISACVLDQKAIRSIEEVGAKVTTYCQQSKDEYKPQVGELCLSLYEDGQWYRAVTVKVVDDNTFEIMFIDYGNITTVKSSSIRKMPNEFLHCCLMNKCNIKGFSKKPSKNEVQLQAIFFNDNQIFNVNTIEMDNNGEYVIDPVV